MPALAPVHEIVGAGTAAIALGHGLVAIIDESDLATVMPLAWSASPIGNTVYAQATRPTAAAGPFTIYMHRLICPLDPSDRRGIDHINGDGLDNRRQNLRPATQQQNLANARPQKGRSSRFKGVSFHKMSGRWAASITVDYRSRYLGLFDDEVAAAAAYDTAALEAFGEFARPNFPPVGAT